MNDQAFEIFAILRVLAYDRAANPLAWSQFQNSYSCLPVSNLGLRNDEEQQVASGLRLLVEDVDLDELSCDVHLRQGAIRVEEIRFVVRM